MADRGARDPRRPWRLALIGAVLLTLPAIAGAIRLHVEPDLLEAFPDAPAAAEYREFVSAFGGFQRIHVVLSLAPESPDRSTRLADAAFDLADRLIGVPGVEDVRAGVDEDDERFLLERVLPMAAFLVPEPAFDRIIADLDPEAVRRRIAAARAALAGPVGEVEARLFAADPLGFARGLPAVDGTGVGPVDPVEGAMLSPTGGHALVVIEPAVSELDATFGTRLDADLGAVFRDLRDAHGEQLEVTAIGGPLYAARDQADVRADVVRTVLGSSIVIAVLLIGHFRGVRYPAVLLATVLLGVLWTAGALGLVHGRVSVLSLAFASIVIGLGIDYGIHGAHAYRDERAGGSRPVPAIAHTLRRTGPSILASAATTAGVFLVLGFARIPPVRELGAIVAVGLGTIVLATVAFGASLLVLTDRDDPSPGSRRRTGATVGRLVRRVRAHRVAVRVGLVVVTLVALVGASRVTFDVDLNSFRPTHREDRRVERILVDQFSLGTDPVHVVVHGANRDVALAHAAELAGRLRRDPAVTSVRSPSDVLPAGTVVDRRRARLARALDEVGTSFLRRELVRAGFRTEPFEPALDVLRRVEERAPLPGVPAAEVPDWVRAAIRSDPDGTRVALSVRGDGTGPETATLARRAAADASLDVHVASLPLVAEELRGLIVREFARLSEFAVGVIVVLVAVSFRGRVVRAVLALVPVFLGVVWMLGLCGWFGIPLNFFTIAAAPLVVGIGIDDGLHAIHGIDAHGGLNASLARVGGAVAMTTWTTCAGFCSLALSHLPALSRGGPLIAGGTFLCLVATLVALPALAPELRR